MFGRPYRIGKIFGIDITVSWSFLVLVAALSLFLAFNSPSFIVGLISGVVSLALLFGSVLVHELGHSLVARRLGVRIAEIELHFFGGAAKMLSMPRRPRDEIVIAAAGPAVSLVLGAVFGVLAMVGVEALGLVAGLATINLMLGTFNLIPALPTDGGRILRAALAIKYDHLKATRIAVNVARVATVGLGIWAIATGSFFVIGVAVFLWFLGTRELRIAEALYRRNGGFFDVGGYGYDPRYTGVGGGSPSFVEVYDRDGRFVGTAPGGVAPDHSASNSPASAPARSLNDLFGALRGDSQRKTARQTYVRGPDGRLWLIREGRSS